MVRSTEVASSDSRVARTFIEERVAERARRNTAEQVQDTCSFARSERLIRREYHGRFLIELLQNAADAWREGTAPGARSRVRIVVGEGPSVLVANQGRPFPATAVIESLGQIGHSTKAPGEAIGHKGIGFKSVLEISLTPELYSGLGASTTPLAVRFDPRQALGLIRSQSPNWDRHLKAVDDIENPIPAVPVLRYPTWVETLPDEIRELAVDGFDTVIRLPFSDELRPDPDMDCETWLRVVRAALSDLSDEMLLLLGTFNRLEIVDGLEHQDEVIEPLWDTETLLSTGATRELVTVTHSGSPMSRWRIYRRGATRQTRSLRRDRGRPPVCPRRSWACVGGDWIRLDPVSPVLSDQDRIRSPVPASRLLRGQRGTHRLLRRLCRPERGDTPRARQSRCGRGCRHSRRRH
jgi:hypothetical protein